jgi:hypothetical protein
MPWPVQDQVSCSSVQGPVADGYRSFHRPYAQILTCAAARSAKHAIEASTLHGRRPAHCLTNPSVSLACCSTRCQHDYIDQ